MTISIIILIVLILTFAVYLIGKTYSLKVCPICAGVSLTWLFLLGGMFSGLLSVPKFELPAAILMGGSVVGIAYKLEDRIHRNNLKLLWKSLFIPVGFAFAYSIIRLDWLVMVAYGAALLIIVVFFIGKRHADLTATKDGKTVKELVGKMDKCC